MSETSSALRSPPALRGLIPAVAALLTAMVAMSPKVLNDGDTWWQIAAGRMMIAQRALLRTDPFSYTFHGAPWLTYEWLSQVVLGTAFNLAGLSGVVILTAMAAGLTAWLLARDLGRWLSGAPWVKLLVFGLMLWSGSLLARPHMLVLPILEVWAAELISARSQARAPHWLMLPLMVLWTNLHGSFVFGLALIGPFALEALLDAKPGERLNVCLRWGGFGIAATLVSLINPHGVQILFFPFYEIQMTSLANIGEWGPADFGRIGTLEIGLLAALFVALTRPVQMSVVRAALLLLLLHLALQHARYAQMLGVVGALVLAQPLAGAVGQKPWPACGRKPATGLLVGLAGSIAAIVLVAIRLTWPVTLHDGPTAPVSAIAALPPQIASRHVLNDYSFGGYLIGQHIAPYIDGRGDFYGDAFLQTYSRLLEPDEEALSKVLTERNIGWTLLVPGSAIAQAMDHRPGWRRLRADRWSVIHVPTRPIP